jgi:hypothetical protein
MSVTYFNGSVIQKASAFPCDGFFLAQLRDLETPPMHAVFVVVFELLDPPDLTASGVVFRQSVGRERDRRKSVLAETLSQLTGRTIPRDPRVDLALWVEQFFGSNHVLEVRMTRSLIPVPKAISIHPVIHELPGAEDSMSHGAR